MKAWTLLFLRVSLGWLLVIWGADKVINVEHGLAGSNALFYPSLIIFAASLLLIAFRDEDTLVVSK